MQLLQPYPERLVVWPATCEGGNGAAGVCDRVAARVCDMQLARVVGVVGATRARTVQQETGRVAVEGRLLVPGGCFRPWGVACAYWWVPSLPRGTAAVASRLWGAHHRSWTGRGVGGGGVGGPRTWWPFRIRAVRVYCRTTRARVCLPLSSGGPEARVLVCGLWAGNVKLAQRWGCACVR